MMKILLTYNNEKLNLELGGTFNFDSKSQCTSGYFMESCGSLKYKVAYKDELLEN